MGKQFVKHRNCQKTVWQLIARKKACSKKNPNPEKKIIPYSTKTSKANEIFQDHLVFKGCATFFVRLHQTKSFKSVFTPQKPFPLTLFFCTNTVILFFSRGTQKNLNKNLTVNPKFLVISF